MSSRPGARLTGMLTEDRIAAHRHELQVHCYRMLGSFEEAEDQVQETLLRAWRRRDQLADEAALRAWLYRIATNTCLDALRRRPREPVPVEDGFEVPWLQPYPDDLLDAVVARETIELAFIVALQHLPPQQRAALILRDVAGWSARDAAVLLETSVAAVTSALQRARETLRARMPDGPARDLTADERLVLRRYMEASDRGDVELLARTLHDEVRFAMPPAPQTWSGRDTVVAGWAEGGFGRPDWGVLRTELTWANRQPAVVAHVKREGSPAFVPLAVDLLGFRDGLVGDVTTFYGPGVFAAFSLTG
jgi:RNA polymerase sigma-70 factor (ECF subfamily)